MSEKNEEIEKLRAVAILLVLVCHAVWISPVASIILSSYVRDYSLGVGVDLFFCVSGYVVARSSYDYFDGFRAKGFFWEAACAFWLRRAWRLLPSAWLWLLVGAMCSLLFNESGVFLDFEQNIKSVVAVLGFSANYAAVHGWLSPNDVYWSLALEEQFYFLFPLFLLFFISGRARILVLLIIVLVQFPLMRNHFGSQLEQYLAVFRVDGFAWGVIVYIFSRGSYYKCCEPFFLKHKPLALFLSALLILLLIRVPAYFVSYSFGQGLLAIIAMLLVWVASYEKRYLFGYLFFNDALLWLGSRSYALYLLHWPIYRIVHEGTVRLQSMAGLDYWTDIAPWDVLITVLMMVVCAELNYRFIEEPLRRFGAARVRARLEKLVI